MLKESSAIDVNEKGSLDSVEISKTLKSGIFAIFAQEMYQPRREAVEYEPDLAA